MEFRENSTVYTANGKEVGVIDRVVIDPGTQEVSHVIVRQGWLFTEDKVVPLAWIEQVADQIRLRADIQNLDDLPHFQETHYLPYEATTDQATTEQATVDQATTDPEPSDSRSASSPGTTTAKTIVVQPFYAYPPIGVAWPGFYTDPMGVYALGAYPAQEYQVEIERNIPEGTVALKEGAPVVDNGGKQVGTVARLFTNDKTQQVTHLLLTKGWLFQEERVIPMNWLKAVTDEEVQLQVSADFLKRLPERHYQNG